MTWVEATDESGMHKAGICDRGFEIPKEDQERNCAPTPIGSYLGTVLCRAHRGRHKLQCWIQYRAVVHVHLEERVVMQPHKEWFEYVTEMGMGEIENEWWVLDRARSGLIKPVVWAHFFTDVHIKMPGNM